VYEVDRSMMVGDLSLEIRYKKDFFAHNAVNNLIFIFNRL
jgi:hypothetical protein